MTKDRFGLGGPDSGPSSSPEQQLPYQQIGEFLLEFDELSKDMVTIRNEVRAIRARLDGGQPLDKRQKDLDRQRIQQIRALTQGIIGRRDEIRNFLTKLKDSNEHYGKPN